MKARVVASYPWNAIRCAGAEFIKGEYRPVAPMAEENVLHYVKSGLLQLEPAPKPKRRRTRKAAG